MTDDAAAKCPRCRALDCQGHPGRHGVTIYWSTAIGRFVTIPDD